jgi:hypothetical protein
MNQDRVVTSIPGNEAAEKKANDERYAHLRSQLKLEKQKRINELEKQITGLKWQKKIRELEKQIAALEKQTQVTKEQKIASINAQIAELEIAMLNKKLSKKLVDKRTILDAHGITTQYVWRTTGVELTLDEKINYLEQKLKR